MIPNSETRVSRGFVLRKIKSISGAAACALTGYGSSGAVARPSLAQTALYFMFVLLVPMLLLGAIAAALHFDASGLSAVALAGSKTLLAFPAAPAAPARKSGTEPKKPANIRQMEANLKALATELEQGQVEMAAGPITQERGEELEQKAQEMEELQQHIDLYNRVSGKVREARGVAEPTLPSDRHGNVKRIRTTAGHLFVASDAFRQFRGSQKNGNSTGWSAKVGVKHMGKLVTLTGEDAVAFQTKAFDPATLSDLGDDAIVEVDRDRELVRFEEPEILTMRDVLNVAPTTSEAIKYVKHIATTRGAASQATRGGLKNYLKLAFEPTTVSVETIAVLAKVTEQDVDDAPRLVSYINGEMSLDVRVEEERQLLWGSGENGQLEGLFAGGEIDEFNRAEVGDTLIDTIRRIRTDLRKRRVSPNFVMVDPIDWEQIELEKGTDNTYIWGLISDLRGPRIWSLRVVESDAMTNEATGQRRVLVGDGIRGATIYDRHDVRLAVGFVDDDFARNLRTLRAEERLALGLKRPFAFEFAVTQDVQS